jgi:Rrf2 family transcriptional regulator, nitric oxide-sensitive transcriptional repressor
MRLTVYTDYTLRVMMYLTVSYPSGDVATIQEIASAYDISRAHLMKIVNELSNSGFVTATRGRTGGLRLARAPAQISVGQLVRMAEKDFAIVPCHAESSAVHCAILPACNLKRGMRRAMDAFIHELDKMTLADTITVPSVARSLLQIGSAQSGEIAVAVPDPRARGRKTARGRV